MDTLTLGAYWHNRPLTLRQYASLVRQYLCLLRDIHPAFQSWEWVGNRPNATIKLAPDLSNLDELVLHHAGGNEQVYDVANQDGTPTWESTAAFMGYGMTFSTVTTDHRNAFTMSISAGQKGFATPNSAVVKFPSIDGPQAPDASLFGYDFARKLLLSTIRLFQPEEGIVYGKAFHRKACVSGLPSVGWLTYLRNEHVIALKNDPKFDGIDFETVDIGGVLITLDRRITAPDNSEQIDKARLLRAKMMQEGWIKG